MGRRRFANESEEILMQEESDPEEDSETDMTTQEEAFNRFSDFADTTRKKRKTQSDSSFSISKNTPARRQNSRFNFKGQSAWDQMLDEFERRKIPRQQAQVIVGIIAFFLLYFVFGGMFSTRRGGAGDLLDCFTVSSDNQGRDIVECRSRKGYNIRVIESHANSILLEVAEPKMSEPGFIYAAYSLVKYSIYIFCGLVIGAFIVTPEGKDKLKILKRKYLEISDEIKRKIENGLKQRDNTVYKSKGRELAGLSGSELESSEDESSEESDSSSSS